MVWFLAAAIVAGVLQQQLLLLAVCLPLVVHALFVRTRVAWCWCLLVGACALVGACCAQRLDEDRVRVRREVAARGAAAIVLDGRVVSYPVTNVYGTAFLFDAAVAGRPVRLWMQAGFFDVFPGDRIVCAAHVTQPAPGGFLSARGAAGRARVQMRDVHRWQRARRFRADTLFWRVHRAARMRLMRSLPDDAALPLGLLLGERGFLPRDLREAVIALGIAHLLALSGMHLAVIAAGVLALARGLGVREDAPLLATLALYVTVVGDVASLWRAFAMVALLVGARVLMRPLRPLDTLGKALFVMLLVSPLSARSPGLQLSFVATGAVLLAVRRVPILLRARNARPGARRRALGWLVRSTAGVIIVGVAVEVLIVPLQLMHFGRVSVVGPLATAVFIVPVTAVQVLSFAAAGLGAVPGVGPAVCSALALASRATVAGILTAAARAPEPLVATGPWLPAYYLGVVVAWRFPRRPVAWGVAVALVVVAFLWPLRGA
ncbi:MAG TPA: ComEC/Rec2 family competence protein [Candidatus Krumholzibacteria bacterium]|nr:ComEC/Rec2 family competence protein [Candidatus Krumholzibacteria bacterium]